MEGVGLSYTTVGILHPILHPKSLVNTMVFVCGCRKCRFFSKTFFLRMIWVVRYPVCRRRFIYGRIQNLVRINKRQQGQHYSGCTLAIAFACVISIAYKKVVLVVYVVPVVVKNHPHGKMIRQLVVVMINIYDNRDNKDNKDNAIRGMRCNRVRMCRARAERAAPWVN